MEVQMGKTADAIGELLSEVAAESKATREIPRRKVEDIPDSLVLIEVTTICKNCKREYPHPNASVLGRFGKNYRKIKKWSSLFDKLDREVLKITEEATSCSCCFQSCKLTMDDVEFKG